MNQLPDQRLNELLDFSTSEEDDEMVQLLTEIKERRKQAGYNREQRLTFMLRFIKDTAPEIARELWEIYREQENAIYYARRDADYWRAEEEKAVEKLVHTRSCLRDAMAFIDPDVAGDYKFWKEALEE